MTLTKLSLGLRFDPRLTELWPLEAMLDLRVCVCVSVGLCTLCNR